MSETKVDLKLIPSIEIDPFDPEAIRLSPADQQTAGEKLLVNVPVRKPNKAEFFRVNADPAFTCDTALLEVEGEFFLVIPRLRGCAASRHQARADLHLRGSHRSACSCGPCGFPAPTVATIGGGKPPTRSPARLSPRGSGWSPI